MECFCFFWKGLFLENGDYLMIILFKLVVMLWYVNFGEEIVLWEIKCYLSEVIIYVIIFNKDGDVVIFFFDGVF